jgi:hypothetical protein
MIPDWDKLDPKAAVGSAYQIMTIVNEVFEHINEVFA